MYTMRLSTTITARRKMWCCCFTTSSSAAASTSSTTTTTTTKLLDFNHHEFRERSLRSLVHAMFVLRLCSWRSLITHSMKTYEWSKRICGDRVVNHCVRRTFFDHFCAGESVDELHATAQRLSERGVGSILSLSIEVDLDQTIEESECDVHARMFEDSVRAGAHKFNSFVALKVTSLCQPSLLMRLSAQICESVSPPTHDLIEQHDESKRLLQRLRSIVRLASESNVRILVDAEQTYFQPAISLFVWRLQQEFNRDNAIVYNTYQAYLKATPELLRQDIHKCNGEFVMGVKLVRGAYMVAERERAHKMKYEDPIWPSLQDTHAAYNGCLELLFEHPSVHIIVASHNQDSASCAIDLMQKHSVDRRSPRVFFGQLMGMCDNVTFKLAENGFQPLKVLPYGSIETTMPYLMRRAQENSAVLGSDATKNERRMLRTEVRRRIFTLGNHK